MTQREQDKRRKRAWDNMEKAITQEHKRSAKVRDKIYARYNKEK